MKDEDIESLTAVEAINRITDDYNNLTELVSVQSAMGFLERVGYIVESYLHQVEDTKIEVDALTSEQASDKMINKIALKYGVTLNQLVGLMNLAEELNQKQLAGTGLTVVPFWFHEQFLDLQKTNESLIRETDSLMATLHAVKESKAGELQTRVDAMILPERKSIITGVQQPYIPGETGPRLGDEHLDTDSIYLPTYNEVYAARKREKPKK